MIFFFSLHSPILENPSGFDPGWVGLSPVGRWRRWSAAVALQCVGSSDVRSTRRGGFSFSFFLFILHWSFRIDLSLQFFPLLSRWRLHWGFSSFGTHFVSLYLPDYQIQRENSEWGKYASSLLSFSLKENRLSAHQLESKIQKRRSHFLPDGRNTAVGEQNAFCPWKTPSMLFPNRTGPILAPKCVTFFGFCFVFFSSCRISPCTSEFSRLIFTNNITFLGNYSPFQYTHFIFSSHFLHFNSKGHFHISNF